MLKVIWQVNIYFNIYIISLIYLRWRHELPRKWWSRRDPKPSHPSHTAATPPPPTWDSPGNLEITYNMLSVIHVANYGHWLTWGWILTAVGSIDIQDSLNRLKKDTEGITWISLFLRGLGSGRPENMALTHSGQLQAQDKREYIYWRTHNP